jgi:hypothetical protein
MWSVDTTYRLPKRFMSLAVTSWGVPSMPKTLLASPIEQNSTLARSAMGFEDLARPFAAPQLAPEIDIENHLGASPDCLIGGVAHHLRRGVGEGCGDAGQEDDFGVQHRIPIVFVDARGTERRPFAVVDDVRRHRPCPRLHEVERGAAAGFAHHSVHVDADRTVLGQDVVAKIAFGQRARPQRAPSELRGQAGYVGF